VAEEEEKTVLICMPINFNGYVVPGSLKVKCDRCSELVWVAPSGWLVPNKDIICWHCGFAEMEKEGTTTVRVTPAQLEEIEEYRRQKQGGHYEPNPR